MYKAPSQKKMKRCTEWAEKSKAVEREGKKELKVKYARQSKPKHWLIEPETAANAHFHLFLDIMFSFIDNKKGGEGKIKSKNLKGIYLNEHSLKETELLLLQNVSFPRTRNNQENSNRFCEISFHVSLPILRTGQRGMQILYSKFKPDCGRSRKY